MNMCPASIMLAEKAFRLYDSIPIVFIQLILLLNGCFFFPQQYRGIRISYLYKSNAHICLQKCRLCMNQQSTASFLAVKVTMTTYSFCVWFIAIMSLRTQISLTQKFINEHLENEASYSSLFYLQ